MHRKQPAGRKPNAHLALKTDRQVAANGSAMTFYDESDQQESPAGSQGRTEHKKKGDDHEAMMGTRAPILSPRKLSPSLQHLKTNLATFSAKHSQAVKRSEEKMINLFANNHGALPQLPQQALQTHQFSAQIPRIDMKLNTLSRERESITTKRLNKASIGSRNKSVSIARGIESTLFPATRAQHLELNYQMAPRQ